MIIEEEWVDPLQDPNAGGNRQASFSVSEAVNPDSTFDGMKLKIKQIEDKNVHQSLRADLVEFLWQLKGEEDD
jgi:hypothetical protein